jgi:hypothetical protein
LAGNILINIAITKTLTNSIPVIMLRLVTVGRRMAPRSRFLRMPLKLGQERLQSI